MAKTVAEYIEENKCVINKLIKLGKLPLKVINEYQIYLHYRSLESEPSKMVRYETTAENLKTNTTSVRIAVRSMEKIVE